MKGNFTSKNALALVTDPQIATTGGNLAKLQETAIAQMDLIKRMESESALRAVLVGLALHRIKASLKHGEFGKWQEQHLKAKRAQVGYYMRLAIVCLEQGGFSKPDMLAIAEGDNLTVATDTASRRVFKKVQDFVGDMSLNELLVEHGLKNTSAGGGGSSSAGATGSGEDPLLADMASYVMGLRSIFCTPDNFKRLPAQQRRDAIKQLASILDEARALDAASRS